MKKIFLIIKKKEFWDWGSAVEIQIWELLHGGCSERHERVDDLPIQKHKQRGKVRGQTWRLTKKVASRKAEGEPDQSFVIKAQRRVSSRKARSIPVFLLNAHI